MCVEVLVEPEGQVLSTVGELSAFLIARGVPPLSIPKSEHDSCLCPVALEITAADAGYRHVQDYDRNPFGVVWEPVIGVVP